MKNNFPGLHTLYHVCCLFLLHIKREYRNRVKFSISKYLETKKLVLCTLCIHFLIIKRSQLKFNISFANLRTEEIILIDFVFWDFSKIALMILRAYYSTNFIWYLLRNILLLFGTFWGRLRVSWLLKCHFNACYSHY